MNKVMQSIIERAKKDPKFFQKLIFEPEDVVDEIEASDNVKDIIKASALRPERFFGDLVGTRVSDCGETCGGSSCQDTCGSVSCNHTCTDSCNATCKNSCGGTVRLQSV